LYFLYDVDKMRYLQKTGIVMKFKKYFFAVYSDIGLWFCSGAGKHIS